MNVKKLIFSFFDTGEVPMSPEKWNLNELTFLFLIFIFEQCVQPWKGFNKGAMHCLDVTTQPNEPDQLMKELKFPRFSEKNPD